jgi:ATP-dependent Clp protease adaptor protein ClpS
MAGIRKDGDGQILEKDDVQVKRPQRYTCVLHNDNYTTQDFVVFILQKIFKLDLLMARSVMLKVHIHGKGNVGDYSYDVASSKAQKVESLAKENEFPLKCTVEQI